MDAPLHEDVADAPKGGRAYWATTSDGIRIRYAVWDGPKGYALIYPGRTEYIEKYGQVICKLAERGIGCVTLDWRNQGLSDRQAKTGHVLDYSEYQRDIECVLDRVDIGTPHLLSHSMGGLIALRSLQKKMPVKSAVFSAPMWGMGLPYPIRSTVKALAVGAKMLGFGTSKVIGTQRGSYIQNADPMDNSLVSDPRGAKWIQRQLNTHPELALGGPSWAWLNASHREINDLKSFPLPDCPTITFLGSDETVVNPQATRDRASGTGNGKLVIVNGAKHEVFMEAPQIQGVLWDELDALWKVDQEPSNTSAASWTAGSPAAIT